VHFLGLLAQWPARFGTNLHAYVLMDNHYHLLVETPEANLSRLEQWLNVSYTNWMFAYRSINSAAARNQAHSPLPAGQLSAFPVMAF